MTVPRQSLLKAPASPAGSLLARIFPIVGQLAGYKLGWVRLDIRAGLSVAAVALPSAIAYPAIANLPVEVGLYAAILPAVGYALFGSSRQLMVGPDTATTLMLGAALLQLGIAGAEDRVAAAAALALLTGVLCVLAGFLRFGLIANFLSRPVLVGFLAGVALDLLVGQINRFTGVRAEGVGLIAPLIDYASKIGQTHLPTLLTGLGLFALLRALRAAVPGFPAPLAAIVVGGVVALAANLPGHGVTVVGSIQAALPTPGLRWPTAVGLNDLVLAALGILVVSFGSGIVTARSFGAKNHYDVDGDRELIGFGAANVASGLFGGFPVTSSDSRTAVNDAVGGKTQIAALVSAVALFGVIFLLGDALAYLPVAALGAILASAAIDLIDVRALASLWRMSRVEFLVAIVTIVGVVRFGVLNGVILAVAATLIHLLWLSSHPRDALLGRIAGRDGLYKLHTHPDAQPVPGLVIYLVQAGLVFFNADHVKKRILEIVDAQAAPPVWFILDAGAVSQLDTTAVAALEDVHAALHEHGIAFAIADLHSRPRAMIERSGLGDRIGQAMLFESTDGAVAAFEARTARQSAAGRS
jgi:high affinity sulfate transporter 1